MNINEQKEILLKYNKPRPFQTINIIMAESFLNFAISCSVFIILIFFIIFIFSSINESATQPVLVFVIMLSFLVLEYNLAKSILGKFTYGRLLKHGDIETAEILDKNLTQGRFSRAASKTATEYTIKINNSEKPVKHLFTGTEAYTEKETIIFRQADNIFPLSIFLHHTKASMEQLLKPSLQTVRSKKSGWGAFLARCFMFAGSIALLFFLIIMIARNR